MSNTREAQEGFLGRIPETGFLRQSQLVPIIVPVGHATFWRMVKDGRFPAPVKLGPKVTAWRAEDVRAWIANPGMAAGQ
jgi:prophage regulatory protein